MLTVPPISDYKPFYIQFNGDASATNILTAYSVIVKTHDYPSSLKVKEPYKNQWLDENGDEEYIGDNGLYFEAFTINLECAMFADGSNDAEAIGYLKSGMRTFQTALAQGFFSTYDSWTGYGFQNVRLDEFPMPETDAYSVWHGKTRLIFDVRLKVNDPITSMVLNNGVIVQG